MENVIDKLRKLISHSESARAIGSIAEAEAFAARAQELLTRHKLDMTDLEFDASEAEEPILSEMVDGGELLGLPDKMRTDRWLAILISGIAESNFCKVLTGRGNRFVIVGKESNRQTTLALFKYLSEACREIAPREARKADFAPINIFQHKRQTRKSFVSGFKLGFAVSICGRLRVKKLELQAGAQAQGLIRLDQMERATSKTFKELFPKTSHPSTQEPKNKTGFVAGKAYGAAVGINSTLRLTS